MATESRQHEPRPPRPQRADGTDFPERLVVDGREIDGSYVLRTRHAPFGLVTFPEFIAEWLRADVETAHPPKGKTSSRVDKLFERTGRTAAEWKIIEAEADRLRARTMRNFEDLFVGPIIAAIGAAVEASRDLAVRQIENSGAADQIRFAPETVAAADSKSFRLLPKKHREELLADITKPFDEVLHAGKGVTVDPLRDALIFLLEKERAGKSRRRLSEPGILRRMATRVGLPHSASSTVRDRKKLGMSRLRDLVRRVSGKPLSVRATLTEVRAFLAEYTTSGNRVEAGRTPRSVIANPQDREDAFRLSRLLREVEKG